MKQEHANREALLEWLVEKVEQAERSLKACQQAAETWKTGTDDDWKGAGCRLTRAQRLKEAAKHGRISIKYARELENFKAVLRFMQRTIPTSNVDVEKVLKSEIK